MKTLLIAIALLFSFTLFAEAIEETGDTRAEPVILYGITSGGDLVAILVDANGVLQTVAG